MSEEADVRPNEPTLGRLLREHREELGLDLSEVARQTHVRREYLSALEDGRYKDLPEDVYSRHVVRLFATTVGLDEVRALEIYRHERAASETPVVGIEPAPREPVRRQRRAPAASQESGRAAGAGASPGGPRINWVTPLATLVLIAAVVGLALWGFNSTLFNPGRNAGQVEEDAGQQPAAGAQAGAQEAEEEQLAAIPDTVRLTVITEPPGAEVAVDGFPLPGSTPIEGAPVTARESRIVSVNREGYEPIEAEFDLTSDRNLSFTLTEASEEEAAADGDGAAEGAAAAGQAGQVVLTVTQDTWLEVYSGPARNQGQRLAFTTAQAGQVLEFPAPVFVYVGNAGGVGVNVDGGDQGTRGSAGEVRGVLLGE